ncbi:MAG: bifunctional DNA-formamidopyrimidine glycosylase/DNA-(apurinic or apyrimidinic site) lyase [Bacillota bacterium]|jgi:formamidopyrimidine-DNA glycosylase
MPELPEVETIKRTLKPLLIGKKFAKPRLLREDIIKHPLPREFESILEGREIIEVDRRGKYLLIYLTDNYILAVHLRMTGRLVYCMANEEQEKHTHVIFPLNNGDQLRFADIRRFGCLWLIAPDEIDDFTGMSRLGLEPLSADFSAQYLKEVLAKRKINIKQALLDQTVIAGLGNIYVDEALFAAGIAPWRKVMELWDSDWDRLAEVIPQVLENAIQNRGTTFSDYVDGEGKKGGNMAYLLAYGREGKPCFRCGSTLIKQRIAGRGSVFCPNCQK